MRALFDYLPIIDHNYIISIPNCAQAVGNDETGTTLHQASENPSVPGRVQGRIIIQFSNIEYEV